MHTLSRMHDHVSDKIGPDSSSGPERYLSVKEEEELVNFLVGCARIGYPRTRLQVLAIVQRYLIKNGCSRIVSSGWWQRFRERHQSLSLRAPAHLSKPRAMAMDRDTIDRYFAILEDVLRDNSLIDKPRQIYNCDESGMPLCPSSPKLLVKKGKKHR